MMIKFINNILNTTISYLWSINLFRYDLWWYHFKWCSKIELTDSNYSSDRNVGKQVFDLLYDTYTSVKNTITSTYTGDMDSNITIAKLKGFKSAREVSLYADNVYINLW